MKQITLSRRWLTPLLCSFLLGVLGCATFAVEFTGRVTDVPEGDSLIFVHNGEVERIRLYAIDCPEPTQRFGQEAKRATAEWARDKAVTVKAWGIDVYTGRMTGIVVLPDGKSLNHELVEAGLAWWDREYPDETKLAELEAQARAAKRGLWADSNPTPPWEFRNRSKERGSSAD